MRYRVIIEQDEDGVFVAEVPSLPGCVTQGASRAEAVSNAREAIAGYLESLESHGDPVPPPISEEIVEIQPWADFRSSLAAALSELWAGPDTSLTDRRAVTSFCAKKNSRFGDLLCRITKRSLGGR